MFTGEKIRLREYMREDMPCALAYLNDPEVKRFLKPRIPFPITMEEQMKWYECNSSSKDKYSFAIEAIEDGRYIGGCGINETDWKNSSVVIGIFIGDKKLWGKGYGYDAVKVLIEFIFLQMNINKIKLSVYAFNERAIKCYEKCGFKREGTLRQEIFRDGKYHDEHIMAILREEFYAGLV